MIALSQLCESNLDSVNGCVAISVCSADVLRKGTAIACAQLALLSTVPVSMWPYIIND
jgi:uncharacterized membrane protein